MEEHKEILQVLKEINNVVALRARLDALEDAKLISMVEMIEDYLPSIEPLHLRDLLSMFLQLVERLADTDVNTLFPAQWAIKNLLENLFDLVPHSERDAVFLEVFESAKDYYQRMEWINTIGNFPNRSSQKALVSEHITQAVIKKFNQSVLNLSLQEIKEEAHLGKILINLISRFGFENEEFDEHLLKAKATIQTWCKDTNFFLALLRDRLVPVVSGMRLISRGPRQVAYKLDWPSLRALLGEDELLMRIQQIKTDNEITPIDERTRQAWQAAKRAAEDPRFRKDVLMQPDLDDPDD